MELQHNEIPSMHFMLNAYKFAIQCNTDFMLQLGNQLTQNITAVQTQDIFTVLL